MNKKGGLSVAGQDICLVEIFISHLSPLHKIILPGTESATKIAESTDFLINRRFVAGILLRVPCIFVADGAKTEFLLRVRACAFFSGECSSMLPSRPPRQIRLRLRLRRNSPKAEDLLQVEPLVWRLRHIPNAPVRQDNSILTCLNGDARVSA